MGLVRLVRLIFTLILLRMVILLLPKLAWRNFDLLGTMKQHFDVPMAWTTDVNLRHMVSMFGNGQHTSSCVYYTMELVLARSDSKR